jgi:hypothetical protein
LLGKIKKKFPEEKDNSNFVRSGGVQKKKITIGGKKSPITRGNYDSKVVFK